ncbi:MAG: hypothetical protein LBQ86_06785 [Holophagales bacterium]|jgi:hypothetical protein|nr:hypothetical protein [Holophagales bacterium]
MSSEAIYQVWYKLAEFSRWELFNTELCSFDTAQAIARSLPISRVTRFGETHQDVAGESFHNKPLPIPVKRDLASGASGKPTR